jgi:hypothetical protein
VKRVILESEKEKTRLTSMLTPATVDTGGKPQGSQRSRVVWNRRLRRRDYTASGTINQVYTKRGTWSSTLTSEDRLGKGRHNDENDVG